MLFGHAAAPPRALAAARQAEGAARRRKRSHPASRIRPATPADIPALLAIEHQVFATDRVSARSFRHLLTRGNSATLVEEEGYALRGYATLLFSRGSARARLYSFAVVHEHRGKGIAKALLAVSEKVARRRGCDYLRLEVRKDNPEAQSLYRKAGYRAFATVPGYYEDEMDALRMEKALS